VTSRSPGTSDTRSTRTSTSVNLKNLPVLSGRSNLSGLSVLGDGLRVGGMTALVGLCGTFSAGLFSWYVLHRHGAGLVLSVLFSMLVVWIYRRSRGGAYRNRTPGGS
jgi:hypothetical protein